MSTPGGVENNQAIIDRLLTCSQRLYNSLNFGFRVTKNLKGKRNVDNL
ncbi:hypothetical protein CK203_023140 [Vitis vinifera]|uniref:Uncharacterized protein n=1 Tax=Vitis vinifera TaxID=29760 RepID=A0A438J1U3_VITVI|nr:hypothetical protein CK203_023140 [Vitis vinifera]